MTSPGYYSTALRRGNHTLTLAPLSELSEHMTRRAGSQAYTTLALRAGTSLHPAGLHQSEGMKQWTAHSCESHGEGLPQEAGRGQKYREPP